MAQQNDTAIEIPVALSLFRSQNIRNTWNDSIDNDTLGPIIRRTVYFDIFCVHQQTIYILLMLCEVCSSLFAFFLSLTLTAFGFLLVYLRRKSAQSTPVP